MSAPLPDALRARFQRYIEEGLSGRAAALRLKLSPATGARWALAIRRTGRAEAAPQGRPKGKGKLDPHLGFFAEVIEQDGDITMPELSAALFDVTRVRAHPNAIGKFLRKLGYTYKKSLVATERHRAKVRRQREDWFKHRIPAVSKHPERVVFIDETSVKTNLTRQRGWAPCGNRLIMDAPFGSWGTQTFIAGLSADAMIAPWVIKGAMDGAAFAAYVEKVLVPELSAGTVVILDNLATHKNVEAEKAMRRAGCWFLFLPPYSPDLNPIEMAFSKLKAHLRRIGARTFTDMFNAIADICDLYSPEECWNYFT
ncbi:IS630 family transposase, partial [Roseovarius sp. A-2]|uniref:IS630 family transposase n=1 Tax=Roseovarius sp. A-2 TaxID=1570360 RepID=UPI001C394ED3